MKAINKVVLIVLNNFVNDTRVLKEALSLNNSGYEVNVVALHEEPLLVNENIDGVSIHRIRLNTRFWPKIKIFQIFKYMEFLGRFIIKYRDVDIIHCNDLETLPIGIIIKKFFNKEALVIYDAHEYEINQIPNQSKLSIKLLYWLEKFLIKDADAVITVSESIASEYKKIYSISDPGVVLNCPNYSEIKRNNIFRQKFGISDKTKIFLYQGGLGTGRGIEILLDSFANLGDQNKVIVFMGSGPLEIKIKEYQRGYKNIFYHDAVPPSELLNFTSSADYGILFYENTCVNHNLCSPNKMFEYIMAGIPVISADLYEMKRLLQMYGIGIVASANDVDGFLKAVKQTDEIDYTDLQLNVKKAAGQFNWEQQEKVLLAAYQSLLRDEGNVRY